MTNHGKPQKIKFPRVKAAEKPKKSVIIQKKLGFSHYISKR